VLRSLAVRDVRNLAGVRVSFATRFTAFAGPNGAGKTNLLEAVWLLSALRSFRTADLGALLRDGAMSGVVEGSFDDAVTGLPSRLQVVLEATPSGARRRVELDDKAVRRAADAHGRLRTILFTPEDLGVLRGSPAPRRALLDRMVFAVDRAHQHDVADYETTVRGRNRLLRDERGVGPQRELELEVWEDRAAVLGARIWTRRETLLRTLAPLFAQMFRQIHQRETEAGAHYGCALEGRVGPVPDGDREAVLREELRQRRGLDQARGGTTVGPHRDDLVVTLAGHEAALFASQGQTRALMLALKLAELAHVRAATAEAPLLLLDDVSSELDAERTGHLFEVITREVGQCLLTTTDMAHVRLPPRAECTVLRVDAGAVGASAWGTSPGAP
jgi:DNA replication and repair protein RecF